VVNVPDLSTCPAGTSQVDEGPIYAFKVLAYSAGSTIQFDDGIVMPVLSASSLPAHGPQGWRRLKLTAGAGGSLQLAYSRDATRRELGNAAAVLLPLDSAGNVKISVQSTAGAISTPNGGNLLNTSPVLFDLKDGVWVGENANADGDAIAGSQASAPLLTGPFTGFATGDTTEYILNNGTKTTVAPTGNDFSKFRALLLTMQCPTLSAGSIQPFIDVMMDGVTTANAMRLGITALTSGQNGYLANNRDGPDGVAITVGIASGSLFNRPWQFVRIGYVVAGGPTISGSGSLQFVGIK
jgi:hypothetical protein